MNLEKVKSAITDLKNFITEFSDNEWPVDQVHGAMAEIDEFVGKFPNGLTSWIETHHEIVDIITCLRGLGNEPFLENINHTMGTTGFYGLANEWTDEFEKKNAGRKWDGEFFDEVDWFVSEKIKQ